MVKLFGVLGNRIRFKDSKSPNESRDHLAVDLSILMKFEFLDGNWIKTSLEMDTLFFNALSIHWLFYKKFCRITMSETVCNGKEHWVQNCLLWLTSVVSFDLFQTIILRLSTPSYWWRNDIRKACCKIVEFRIHELFECFLSLKARWSFLLLCVFSSTHQPAVMQTRSMPFCSTDLRAIFQLRVALVINLD